MQLYIYLLINYLKLYDYFIQLYIDLIWIILKNIIIYY